MTDPDAPFRLTLHPRGPVVWRRTADCPEGYVPLGPVWAVRLPPGLSATTLSDAQAGMLRIRPLADADNAPEDVSARTAALRAQVAQLWSDAVRPMRPDPAWPPPVSVAGMMAAPRLDQAASPVAALAAACRAVQALPDPPSGMSTAISLILRTIAVLDLPSMTTVDLRRQGGGWVLQVSEEAALERLSDRVGLTEVGGGQAVTLHARAALEAGVAPAQLAALARAVQLARIVAANWTGALPRMQIATTHRGLNGQWLRMTLSPADWGLPLQRLVRRLRDAVADGDDPAPFHHLLPLRPQVDLVAAPPMAPDAGAPTGFVPAAPVGWQAEGGPGRPRWTYAGTGGLLADLPFAIDAAAAAPALLHWLDGPRRSAGYDTRFGRLYLQGLEYRLLADHPPAAEIAAIVIEVAAIGDLAPGEEIGTQARTLIDWLGATGRRQTGTPSQERPLTVLVQTGARVAAGRPLDGGAVWALGRHWFGCDADKEAFVMAFDARRPGGLMLRPPRVMLTASYVSLSGRCDDPYRSLAEGATPVPDLRVSAVLARVIAATAQDAGT